MREVSIIRYINAYYTQPICFNALVPMEK